VSRFTPEQLERVRRVALGLMADDEDAILDGLVEMGVLRDRGGFDTDVLLAPLRRSLQPMHGEQPFRYTKEMLEEIIAESLRLRVGVNELRLLQRLQAPKEYALLLRSTVGIEAILGHLEAAIDFDRLFTRIWGDDYVPPPGRRPS